MSIFDNLGHGMKQPDPRNPRSVVQQAGLNVPDSITNTRDLALYLMDSGQVVGPRLQMARAMMDRMRLK